MNLVNIYNFKQFIYLFLRDPEGNLKCRKIKSFRPYWFEPNPNGKYISFDNVKLEKKIANEPKEVPQLRSDNSYESDIIYTTRYIYDHIDTFDKTMIKWAMIDIEVLTPKGSGVPNTYEAKYPITSITLYNSKYDKVKNWFLGDYYKKIDNKKLAEINMMKDFIDYLKKAKFDLIMGYYMCDFDYPYCFSSDTEVLTENGWMLFKEIVDNKLKIKIATLNPKTNKVEYHYPEDYIKYKYKGKMFYQGGKYVNSLVTKNHKMWVRNPNKRELGYKSIEARYVPRTITYKKDFPIKKKGKRYFFLPPCESSGWGKFRNSKKILMNDWLEFLGWYLSEGHIYNNNNRTIVISQSKKTNQAKCKKIEYLLTKMNIGWSYHGHKYCFSSVQLHDYLKQFGKSYEKFIPRKVLNNISKNQANLLLKTLINGDGTKRKKDAYTYTTTSKQLADDVQELALKAGYVAFINKQTGKKEHYKDMYYINISTKFSNHSPNREKDLREYVPYNDNVYCLTVPNHLMYVRRSKNSGHWSGNCYHRFNHMPQKYFFDKSSKYNNFAVAISPIGKVRGSGDRRKDFFYPAGTSIIDYLMLFKKIYKNERSNALDSIMEKYLGKGKKYKDVDFSKVDEVVRQRNIGDVEGMRDLEYKKFKLIPFYDEVRRMAKIGWEDLEYPLRIVEPFFFEEAKKKGVILPSRKSKEELTDVDFEGAHRKAYHTGRFFDATEYDLSGAYLNAVADLCLDSANIKEAIGDNKTLSINVTNRETQEIVETYLVEQNEEAILPSVAKKLLNEKQRFKDLRNNTNPESKEFEDIDKKYDAIKSIVLSSWGVMGNKYFRLYDYRVASMITSTIRDLLHYVENELERRGYTIIYVDTDSVFIRDKEQDLTKLLNELVQKWSQERFGKPSSIEFERKGFFEKLFILGRCHYKGYRKNKRGEVEEIDKGIEVKRKDSTVFMAKFQDELLNKILNNEEEQSIRTWINNKIEELKSKKVPLMDIAFPAHINKDYDKSTPIFQRALNYTQEINPNFIKEKGDLFYWIYVEPFGNEIEKISVPYYKEKKITPRILVDVYIENKLFNYELLKDMKLKDINTKQKKDLLFHLNSAGLVEWKEESKKGKAKNVLAFDENTQDHIKNIDWAQMVARNITNKVEAIFQAQGWNCKGITLQKGLKSAVRTPQKGKNKAKNQ